MISCVADTELLLIAANGRRAAHKELGEICRGVGSERTVRSGVAAWTGAQDGVARGASRSRLLMILGVNCSSTRLKICPDSVPGALTK